MEKENLETKRKMKIITIIVKKDNNVSGSMTGGKNLRKLTNNFNREITKDNTNLMNGKEIEIKKEDASTIMFYAMMREILNQEEEITKENTIKINRIKLGIINVRAILDHIKILINTIKD